MFFIIEIQANKTGEQAAIAPILGYTDKDKAISAFYYKLVYAADPDLSKVEKHTVMLIDHLGQTLMHNVFEHEFPAPEPEPEPEPTPDPEPEEDAPAEEPEEVEEVPEEEPVEEPIEEPVEDEPVEEEPIEEEPVEEPTEEQEEPEDVGSL